MKHNNERSFSKEILLGESLFFGLLGRVLYDQPDKDWLNSLIEDDVFSEVPFGVDRMEIRRGQELVQRWALNHEGTLNDESFEELNADYTRLFVGVGKVLAPPWESVYFNDDRMVFQEQTIKVRNWYRRFGLESEKIHKEPDDHIGLQMLFISYLAKLALQAFEEQDEEKFEGLLEAQTQFLSEHLLKWGPYWCNLVSEHAQTDFYKGLALLTRGALFALAKRFDLQIFEDAVQ